MEPDTDTHGKILQHYIGRTNSRMEALNEKTVKNLAAKMNDVKENMLSEKNTLKEDLNNKLSSAVWLPCRETSSKLAFTKSVKLILFHGYSTVDLVLLICPFYAQIITI